MKVTVAAAWNKPKSAALEQVAADYLKRLGAYCTAEAPLYRSEAALLGGVLGLQEKGASRLVLLDSRGRGLSSEHWAEWLRRERDGGCQRVVFAVGPADGWSEEARERADMLLSLGPITLPHELARVVLLEQVYRAFTILAGHPYHCGH